MDNGFLQLNHVRIPRDHMLMKYSQVAPDGTYTRPPTDKITYGPMVLVRSGIVMFTGRTLAKAVTIATRYSVVRQQGQTTPGLVSISAYCWILSKYCWVLLHTMEYLYILLNAIGYLKIL